MTAATAVLLSALTSFAWLVIMFVPLERAFPANRNQGTLRNFWLTDVAFFFGQHLAFGMLVVSWLALVAAPLSHIDALVPTQMAFASQPLWLQAIEILLMGDFVAYWGHRLQHHNAFLWRFHSVHHSSESVDWLAAHREHPLDGLYTQSLINLPLILVGFDLGAALGLVAFRSLWAIFIHSNVRLPLGPIRYLFGSPLLHRWHHARNQHAGNYANLAPWIDVVFGTYHEPEGEPEVVGIDDALPTSYVGLLVQPLLMSIGWRRHHPRSRSHTAADRFA